MLVQAKAQLILWNFMELAVVNSEMSEFCMGKPLAFANSKDAVYLPGRCGPASDD
jgi:hypothetical protein